MSSDWKSASARGPRARPPDGAARERSRHPEAAGVALAALAAIAFGTLAIFAKLAYREGADVLPLLGARFTIGSLLLAGYHAARRIPLRLPNRRSLRLVLPLGLAYSFASFLFFLALEYADAAVVSLVFYSFPLWTSVLAFSLGLERFTPRTVVALGLGSAGVALIFSLPRTGLAGPLIALAAAVALAAYLVAAQVSLRSVRPSVAATWTAVSAALALTLASIVRLQGLPVAALGPAVGLSVATALAFMAFYEAIARIGSAKTAVGSMLEPVATVVLAAVILHEAITMRIAAGAVLVVSALPILASRRAADMPPAPDDM